MLEIAKPPASEYAPYASAYIELVPDDGRVIAHMREGLQTTRDLVLAQPPALLDERCASGEWNIKEILVHVADTERVLAYRALCIARGDTTVEFPGFEQDDYAANSGAAARTIESILAEYQAVRQATLALFESFEPAVLTRVGRASNNPLSVRAAAYFIVGHERYHLRSIRENYLS